MTDLDSSKAFAEKGKQTVVVVGASPKPDRYSNRAVRLLLQHGHEVLPINPTASSIEGLDVLPNLKAIRSNVDTVTLYVSPHTSSELADDLITLRPARVIFNPGAENPDLKTILEEHGIPTEEACTLVLLNTDQF